MQPKLSDVLEEVNLWRTLWNLKPLKRMPKGKRESPCGCPLYKALRFRSVQFCGYLYKRDYDNRHFMEQVWDIYPNARVSVGLSGVHLPDILRDFIVYFDLGYYPELEE